MAQASSTITDRRLLANDSIPAPVNSPTLNAKDAFNPDWEVHGERELCSGGLLIRHDTETPDEIELPAFSNHLLILALTEGSRQVHKFCGKEHDDVFPVGSCWLLPAGESGFFSWESTDECVSFMVEPQILQQTAMEIGCLGADKLELQPIIKAADPQLYNLALQFKQELQNNFLGGELYSESLANLFNIHLLRNYCTSTPILRSYSGGLSTKKLQQAIDYIQAHLDEKLSLESIATQLNLSVHYFCELFTQSTGIPPYKYVLQQRVDRAQQLLRNSQKSLSEIALDCGFADQSHLSRHFTKLTRISPKKYRDRFR
jgi:AraC family transcriptional regulator